MSKILEEVLNANEQYARSFDKGDLAMPPARRFAVLTCMDARLDPAKFAGLSEGDAHVIRNAGGRASDDTIRSLNDIPIYGYIYDVTTGRMMEVPEATQLGKAA
jgi:carbonic anhydrase